MIHPHYLYLSFSFSPAEALRVLLSLFEGVVHSVVHVLLSARCPAVLGVVSIVYKIAAKLLRLSIRLVLGPIVTTIAADWKGKEIREVIK